MTSHQYPHTFAKQRQHGCQGQAMITVVVFFLIGSLILITGVAGPVVRSMQTVRLVEESRQSFFASESGAEDVAYRIKNLLSFSLTEVLALGNATTTTLVSQEVDRYELIATGDERELLRKTRVVIVQGGTASFNYGLQADVGGVHLKNTASIVGNVYANGPVTGQNSNIVRGDVVSAGPSGLIDGVHATGTARAHTIENATIDGDAYYQVISNTTVGGSEFPDSPDQATTSLPIDDETIEEWKTVAENNSTYTEPCPYVIDDGSTTLSAMKIACDLKIKGDAVVTLSGPLWVEGDIEMSNTAIVQVSSSQSGKSIPIIADNPADAGSSGTVTLSNSVLFIGSGDSSYILLISQNNSAQSGGGTTAIEVQNSVSGDYLVYAGHGEIVVKNNIELKEITGYRVEAQNSAEITYESGLANLLFSSGPGGGFIVEEWEEIE